MAFCENCGKEVKEDAKFCGGCGTPVEAIQSTPIVKTAASVPAVTSNINLGDAGSDMEMEDAAAKAKKKKQIIGAAAAIVVLAVGVVIIVSATRPYAVNFDANGGNGAIGTKSVKRGNSVELPQGNSLTRDEYAFAGWNTKSDGTGTDYGGNSQYKPDSSITLYAMWNAAVILDVNGGDGTASTHNVRAGEAITLPGSVSRTGYTFGGWNTKSDGTGANYDANSQYKPTGNITLYAEWNPYFIDSRDGKKYKIAAMGSQTWMAENLSYSGGGNCYGDNPANCAKYGRLYTWSAALSACPAGWHLASDADWTQLVKYVGSSAGKKLKTKSGWHWEGQSGNGTDNYGFSALPGGACYCDDGDRYCQCNSMGGGGFWWSAAGINASSAWRRMMGYGIADVLRNSNDKTDMHSVRCVRD